VHDQILLLPVPRQLTFSTDEYLLDGTRLIVIQNTRPQELLFTARRA